MYICVLGVSILPLSTMFQLNFGNVLTVWYMLWFSFHFYTLLIVDQMAVIKISNIYILPANRFLPKLKAALNQYSNQTILDPVP